MRARVAINARGHEAGAAPRGHETGAARRVPFGGGRRTRIVSRALPAVSCPRKLVSAALAIFTLASAAQAGVVFRPVDLVITSDAPLAAWQVEVRYDRARVKILSLEGGGAGEEAAWREPPYHDARGMAAGRIVLAAFVEDDVKATTGRARVARLHVQIEVPEGGAGARDAAAADIIAAMKARLVVAAQAGGERIAPKVELVNVRPAGAAGRGVEADKETEDEL